MSPRCSAPRNCACWAPLQCTLETLTWNPIVIPGCFGYPTFINVQMVYGQHHDKRPMLPIMLGDATYFPWVGK
eukprot:10078807-Alexandrium_andersonii.AAC.1